MALHLITGYAGSEHITSKDQGAYNMATFGSGNFVLDRGEKFKNAVASNNSIIIYDGEAMLQGRFIKMPAGTTESVTIENGASGQTRNDLICIRYTKNTTNNTESASLVVIKGTPNGGDPSYNTGLITDGDANVSDFPLYRVSLNGINIASVTALFSVKVSMTTYMSNYQMPNATSTSKGAVQIGSGINVSNGVISVPAPTPYSLPTATSDTLGGVKVGDRLNISNGVLSAKRIRCFYGYFITFDTSIAAGAIKNSFINDAEMIQMVEQIKLNHPEYDYLQYTDFIAFTGITAFDGNNIDNIFLAVPRGNSGRGYIVYNPTTVARTLYRLEFAMLFYV